MHKKKNSIYLFLIILVMLHSFTFATTEEDKEIIKKARGLAKLAKKFARELDIPKSVSINLEVSEIYKKLIINSPDNNIYKKNYEHYLNQTGQVQLKYAKNMAKKKKLDIAAKYYYSAIKSYKSALKKIPGNKNFLQNIEFCSYYGGISSFTHLLNNNSSAPEFSIEAIGGGKINLKEFKGKPVIIKFWTSWCPECKKNMLLMKKIYNEYNSKKLQIISISLDKLKLWKKSGSDKKAAEISKNLPFKSGWGTKELYYKYGVFRSVPALFLLDKDLKIIKLISSKNRTIEKLRLEVNKLL